jgi:hypothetical protein
MAQANNLNNTSSRWRSLAQTLVWIIRRIEMLPRDAEQIANSPEMNHKIERALNELKGEFWRAILGMTEGMPIDMFRILCGRRYVDLLTLIQLPSGVEPGGLSAAMHQLQRGIRWQDVECNSDWLKRAFPASAPASVPVTNTEPSVAEPEAASVDAMTTEPTQQILRMSRKEQSHWLKMTLADNPPGKDEPLTPEGYGKRIAKMGMPLGAMYEPSTVIARYYQLNPGAPRRRKPRK